MEAVQTISGTGLPAYLGFSVASIIKSVAIDIAFDVYDNGKFEPYQLKQKWWGKCINGELGRWGRLSSADYRSVVRLFSSMEKLLERRSKN